MNSQLLKETTEYKTFFDSTWIKSWQIKRSITEHIVSYLTFNMRMRGSRSGPHIVLNSANRSLHDKSVFISFVMVRWIFWQARGTPQEIYQILTLLWQHAQEIKRSINKAHSIIIRGSHAPSSLYSSNRLIYMSLEVSTIRSRFFPFIFTSTFD